MFRYSVNEQEEIGVTVVMDEVVRQRDPHFRAAIQEMRDGNMSNASIASIQSRRLDCLSPEEQNKFQREGLYIMPT